MASKAEAYLHDKNISQLFEVSHSFETESCLADIECIHGIFAEFDDCTDV